MNHVNGSEAVEPDAPLPDEQTKKAIKDLQNVNHVAKSWLAELPDLRCHKKFRKDIKQLQTEITNLLSELERRVTLPMRDLDVLEFLEINDRYASFKEKVENFGRKF